MKLVRCSSVDLIYKTLWLIIQITTTSNKDLLNYFLDPQFELLDTIKFLIEAEDHRAFHYVVYILTNILATSEQYLPLVNQTPCFAIIKKIIENEQNISI